MLIGQLLDGLRGSFLKRFEEAAVIGKRWKCESFRFAVPGFDFEMVRCEHLLHALAVRFFRAKGLSVFSQRGDLFVAGRLYTEEISDSELPFGEFVTRVERKAVKKNREAEES